jgi:hypothetical protein
LPYHDTPIPAFRDGRNIADRVVCPKPKSTEIRLSHGAGPEKTDEIKYEKVEKRAKNGNSPLALMKVQLTRGERRGPALWPRMAEMDHQRYPRA